MTQNPSDLDAVAKRFLDIWQEQWAHLATHPDTAPHFTKMMDLMTPARDAAQRFFHPESHNAQPPQPEPERPERPERPEPESDTAGTKAIAAALDTLARGMAHLVHRLDAVGERLDDLERVSEPQPKKKPTKKPISRQSAKSKPRKTTAASKPAAKRRSPQPSHKRKAKPAPKRR